ncbi:penicillin-binding protein 1A [Pseudochelatococcus contaminans]|uniref:Penicillin-binding protein 1A n=1 Tax=Pseudochelatococcus contaminans TaxID=1538103 RepID=A0A7W5Z2W1_9HYPH|nr:penicillin-binding protein 1A [Pseudochelatococcus contaminans]MBB3808651.1 penicillin-binding protein 1A [Pseudochelatococcus contaminans]
MRFLLRFVGFVFASLALLFIGGAAVAGLFIWKYTQDLPDYSQLANYQPPVTTRVHAGDGSLLAEYSRERRLYLPISATPKLIIDAFLSAEDKNFYTHNGVDPEGIVRAVVSNARSGGRPQGASTITQQVAKNFLLTNERSYDRKIREILVALRMENVYTKEKILELYLNEIYLGMGNYGIAAAALNYFNKSVNELTLAEAAYLAALPKGPNNYNPYTRNQAAVDRRNWVLDRMVDNGYITAETAAETRAVPLTATPRTLSPNTYVAGYFAEEVRRQIAERYGHNELYEGGLSVRTTLDPRLQAAARKVLTDGLVRYDEARGWRGTVETIELNGDWGEVLAKKPVLGDIRPWELAVVLSVDRTGARIGLQPGVDPGGRVDAERRTGLITADGVRWTRRGLAQVLSVGDIVYVEPQSGNTGNYRLRQLPAVSGAIVAMDPATGRVFAMVGGFSFDQSEFNRAIQALRQPGSAFKPFVYAAAIDNGYTPSSIVVDGPIEIDQGPGIGMWRPENYERRFAGPRTLRYGLERSKNLMTVRLARDVGMPLIIEYTKRFGIMDDMPAMLSMSLGAGETTVMRLTAAYAMFVNGGRHIRPTLIDHIQDRWGKTLFRHDQRVCDTCTATTWENQPEPTLIDNSEQVLDPLSAYQVVSMLEGVVERGTGRIVAEVGKPLAGKTGTTNDAKDVWFVGFSPDLAVGVYMGFDRPRSLGAKAQAAAYAAPMFRDFMKIALEDKPATPFRVPPGIKLVKVDANTGKRTSGSGKGVILEAFKPGTAPPDSGGSAQVAEFGEPGQPAEAPMADQGPGGFAAGGLY